MHLKHSEAIHNWTKCRFLRRLSLLPSAVICFVLSLLILLSGQAVVTCLAADQPRVHDAPLEEFVDFYQYTDKDGVIHFTDAPEKIPRYYRNRATVRRELPYARQVTKVAVVDGQIHLPVTLIAGSKTVQAVMLLDTGASITCISAELAGRLQLEQDNSRSLTVRLADGSEIDVRLARIDAVSVGARVKAPLEIGIIQQTGKAAVHDGLLGLDFLGDFQYQIDLPNGRIHWQ